VVTFYYTRFTALWGTYCGQQVTYHAYRDTKIVRSVALCIMAKLLKAKQKTLRRLSVLYEDALMHEQGSYDEHDITFGLEYSSRNEKAMA
jgi:hypothetical protein